MKSIGLKLKKERAILSDVLPYETPIIFSNRFFYEFLVSNNIEVDGSKIKWTYSSRSIDEFIFIIFGISESERKNIKNNNGVREYEKKNGTFITVPFFYGVSHKEDSFRRLAVMHPRNQVQVIDFYNKYKEIILYYSSRSKFSLRYPSRVATTRFYDDERKSASVALESDMNRKSDSIKNLRSFFSYRKIRNIHEFFESRSYHDSEKRYDNMAQLDVSKCFDSIYTHSIAWAVRGKSFVKGQVAEAGADILISSFPDDFDTLMQKQNYNETNGIIIGPELSRVFSELIFQRVDVDVEAELDKEKIIFDRDYKIFRYVDDYFIFYNDVKIYKTIVSCLSNCLAEYKLGLNTEKELSYVKPIITEVTIAKKKISDLLDEKVVFKVEIIDETEDCQVKKKVGSISIYAKSLITKFKIIIKESETEYKSVNNFTLTVLESKVISIIKNFIRVDNQQEVIKDLLGAFISVIEFSFFIYSVSPRVNITIKLCRVLREIIEFCKSSNVCFDDRSSVFKEISKNVHFIIAKYDSKIYTQVETLYLLVILSELGRDYWLKDSVLIKYFGGTISHKNSVTFDSRLNYFSITSLLFYMKDKRRYNDVRKAIVRTVYEKISDVRRPLVKDTENLLILLDCISCPYLNVRYKKLLLKKFGVTDSSLQSEMISLRCNWFTKWKDFQLGEELDSKQSDYVY